MFNKKYRIVYQENKQIKIEKVSKEEFEKNLLSKNIISLDCISINFELKPFIKEKDIKNRLYELNLMINSSILLDDALDILIKNEKNKELKYFLSDLKDSFCSYSDINTSLKKYRINSLVKSLFKIIQESGNINSNIEFLSETIRENYEIKKEFIKTMFYPILLIITFIFSLIGIFEFVVPNFESILTSSNLELSFSTKTLFLLRNIFENHMLSLLFILAAIFSMSYFLYKRSKKLKLFFDKFLSEKIFLFSKLYKLKVLHLFFVVFEILLKNRFELIYSIGKAKILLKNQYLLDRITQIEYLLKKGKSVRFAFESSKLFDDITLSLIETGEVTNSLPKVISEIKDIYKKRFDDTLKIFSLLIEPLFFIIIMVLILWIVFAVFVPLWSMTDMIKI